MRYYIDTCIWIDFVEGRANIDIFVECIQNENIVIQSYLLQKELGKYIKSEHLTVIFALLSGKGLIENVSVNEEDKVEAFKISSERAVPFADALHAILARNNDAILLTRDKHFLRLKDICRVRLL
jgi:predicted nucleic acid-binding protein